LPIRYLLGPLIDEPAGAKVDKKRLSEDNEDAYGLREAWQIALRNLVLLRPRTVVPLLIIALLACALDFFAGCQRVLMQREESRAAFAQGLGQLAIVPTSNRSFPDEEPERLRGIVAATPGVALVVPHLDRRDALQYVAVFLTTRGDEDRVLALLNEKLHNQAPAASVIRANLLSGRYRAARRLADAELGVAGLALLALAGAISFWAAAVNGKRRRRELVVLRNFGLRRRGITAYVMAEGLVIGIGAVVLASMLSSATSWVVEGLGWQMPVELDPVRLLGTMAALLGVSVASAAIPALRAGDVH
jgi:hypothetical protein